MRIALTGANGFLGQSLARLLAQRGHAVAGIIRGAADPVRRRGLEDLDRIVEGSIEDVAALEAPLAEFRPDVLIHAAWAGVAGPTRDSIDQLRNVVAAGALASLAGRVGATTFIGIGSQAEYGPVSGSVDETRAPHPVSLYGIAKLSAALATERLCALNGLRWSWIRVFSVFGPRDNPRNLIPSLIEGIARGERPRLTACTQLWDYLYLDDAASAVAAVAEANEAAGLFNLGSGQAPPLLQTVSRLRDLLDPVASLGLGEIPYGPNPILHLQADIARLTAATGWRPTTSLDEGLRATIDWHEAQRTKTP